MSPVAQTILQLYRQLLDLEYPEEDLVTVRRAYEVGSELFSAVYHTSTKTLLAHGIGTASVLARLKMPAEVVAAGIIHNVYWNGDFGDGHRGISPRKVKELRRRLSEGVEQYVAGFALLKWGEDTLPGLLDRLDEMKGVERMIMVIRLADQIDHLLDYAIAVSPNSKNRHAMTGRMLESMDPIARRLGYPEIADEMRELLDESLAANPPDCICRKTDSHFAFRVMPRSGPMRWTIKLRERIYLGFGIRKTLRKWFA